MFETKHFYEFGAFRLDPAERLLLRDNQPVPLAPKAFDTLVLLVENSGRLRKGGNDF
jgi:DNA-binding winged helix-turn-helix (wHTH) protein